MHVLLSDGLVFAACSPVETFPRGHVSIVCDRSSITTDVTFSKDCHKIVPNDGASRDRFGYGGAALSSN